MGGLGADGVVGFPQADAGVVIVLRGDGRDGPRDRHEERRRHPLAGDIGDHDAQAAVGQDKEIVEVAPSPERPSPDLGLNNVSSAWETRPPNVWSLTRARWRNRRAKLSESFTVKATLCRGTAMGRGWFFASWR